MLDDNLECMTLDPILSNRNSREHPTLINREIGTLISLIIFKGDKIRLQPLFNRHTLLVCNPDVDRGQQKPSTLIPRGLKYPNIPSDANKGHH